MTDIIETLRDGNYKGQEGMRNLAAAEIERLRAALDEIIYTDADPKDIATNALGWVRIDQRETKP